MYKLVSFSNFEPKLPLYQLTPFPPVYSIITDFICALLPALAVWNLQIARPLKLAVCCLMSLGLMATACAIVRATSLNTRVTDMSYEYCIASIWASTELQIVIIATNLSLGRSIFRFFVGSSVSYSYTDGTKTQLSSPTYGSNGMSRLGSSETMTGNGSDIDLAGHQVLKQMEFHLEEGVGNISNTRRTSDQMYVTRESWNQNPRKEKGNP